MANTGIDFVVSIDVAGVPTRVAGQRGATLNRSVETTDRTTKDSDGNKEFGVSFSEWSIEADGLLVESNAALMALEDAFNEKEAIEIELITFAGNKYQGMAFITDLPIEAPHDDEATYSVTFQGTGALTKVPATP